MQDSSDIIISLHTECMLTPLLLLSHLRYLEYSYLCLTCAELQCIRRNAFCGSVLVHGHETIIFVVSVGLSVCLFVQSFSQLSLI